MARVATTPHNADCSVSNGNSQGRVHIDSDIHRDIQSHARSKNHFDRHICPAPLAFLTTSTDNNDDDDPDGDLVSTYSCGEAASPSVSLSLSPTASASTAHGHTSAGVSVAKTLAKLRSTAANRSCGDCGRVLIDPSDVWVSVCLGGGNGSSSNRIGHPSSRRGSRRIALQDFGLTHRAFAPDASHTSGSGSSGNAGTANRACTGSTPDAYEEDPSFTANQRFGGHGVFVCGPCAVAHRALASSPHHHVRSMRVERAIDTNPSPWTEGEALFLGGSHSGNARARAVYEAFVPAHWEAKRPLPNSPGAVRLLWCRAKYEALAFCLPQPGPIAGDSWKRVLPGCRRDQGPPPARQKQKHRTGPSACGSPWLGNIGALSLGTGRGAEHDRGSAGTARLGRKRQRGGLPDRLVDYFCVVSASMEAAPASPLGSTTAGTKARGPPHVWPHVSDCYPPENAHGEMGYMDHLASFAMPGGCKPTLHPKPPSFSSFVLTLSDGTFVYGGALTIYDDHADADELGAALGAEGMGFGGAGSESSSSTGNTSNSTGNTSNTSHTGKDAPEVYYFPKCLVLVSHYAFFDLFRTALLELYRISLVAAPLPIERYLSNFVMEVPLPPRGCAGVDFSFSQGGRSRTSAGGSIHHPVVRIQRPPPNELPMADFSYRPLFAALSVGNILVVLGYLLQESRVVLLSRHHSLLTPVAEALLSAIFPFRWVGLYIPVAPLKMMDILDAPIPYFIGLSSDYFKAVDVADRPADAIFVDLDLDTIHIGRNPLPRMPEPDAQKLAASLEEAGGSVYVIPNSGIKGCIMAGSDKDLLVPNEQRPRYAHMTTMTGLGEDAFVREALFAASELAYGGGGADRTASGGGSSSNRGNRTGGGSDGKKKPRPLFRASPGKRPPVASPIKKPRFAKNKKADIILSRSHYAMNQGNLLDMAEPEGFSVAGIRGAFLRFVVATFAHYQDSLLENSGRRLFDEEKFVGDVASKGRPMAFLRNVLKTQLFQRFLEERRENPNLPEIRFFDESIAAKRNRSKKASLAMKGKQPTPFLDDKTSWKIREVYASPPPNNFGIPDTEATYRYETFPVLDKTRFGRIRPPPKWPQHTNLDSVRYSKKSDLKRRKKQSELVTRAMKPVLAAPKAVAAAARRTAKDLESTLVALSMDPTGSEAKETIGRGAERKTKRTPSRGRVKTLSTADTIMMDARRKQAILLDVIVAFQALCRGYLVRRYHHEGVEWEQDESLDRKLAYRHYHVRKTRATMIQSVVRMFVVRRKAERTIRAIVLFQSHQRARSGRRRFDRMRCSAIAVAKCVRGRRTKVIYRELRRMIALVQSRARGVLVRSRTRAAMKECMDAYANQIFVLWARLHVSLFFRTRLWPEISGCRTFVGLRVAESELLRLWDIAGVSNRSNGHSRTNTKLLFRSAVGFGNDTFPRYKECTNKILGDKSIASKFDNARRMEETERLQIHERLGSSVSGDDLAEFYSGFGIQPKKKLKKVALSRKLWTDLPLANLSASSMHRIFPELHNSLGVRFVVPSSKGRRRFRNAPKASVPLVDHALWEEISTQGRTKRCVQEVGMLFINKVPSPMKKVDSTNNTFEIHSFLRATMEVNGFESIEEARRSVITQYLG